MGGGGGNPLTKALAVISPIGTGIAHLGKSLIDNMKPPQLPDPAATPVTTPPPSPSDRNDIVTAQQKQRKLAALQQGFASTVVQKASNAPPGTVSALKTKLGQ